MKESWADAGTPEGVTELLLAWSHGDQKALDELVPLVHASLRRIAQNYLRKERSNHTLETAGLVNEAFLRLIDQRQVEWQDRAHFFAIASQLMRRILVDHSRRQGSAKRGGKVRKISLADLVSVGQVREPELIALDDALKSLAERDEVAAKVVEMRFFGGLGREEIAGVLGVSSATVTRRWLLARAWLHSYLVREERHEL